MLIIYSIVEEKETFETLLSLHHMPIIQFNNQKIDVNKDGNLKKAIIKAGLSPYNGGSKYLNCKGIGTCGTCAVEIISGEVSEKTAIEKWRLNFPPHKKENQLRLACQVKVKGDIEIVKHEGFWGQKL